MGGGKNSITHHTQGGEGQREGGGSGGGVAATLPLATLTQAQPPRRHSISHNPVLPSQLCPRPSSVFEPQNEDAATGHRRLQSLLFRRLFAGVGVRLTHLRPQIESSRTWRDGGSRDGTQQRLTLQQIIQSLLSMSISERHFLFTFMSSFFLPFFLQRRLQLQKHSLCVHAELNTTATPPVCLRVTAALRGVLI